MVANNRTDRATLRLMELKCMLHEPHVQQSYRQSLADCRELQRLATVTGIQSPHLLERLLAAGFRAENIGALPLLPVAMVAWASGEVTREEARVAEQAVAESAINANNVAMDLFRSWLQTRPPAELQPLWQAFTAERLHLLDPMESLRLGWAVMNVANQVAKTSGGFLGFATICETERQILNRIGEVHRLASIPSDPSRVSA